MVSRIFDKLRRKIIPNKNSGYIVENKALIYAYENNESFPRLVSFPRTGSHWLRMIMELYFEKPSLVYVFYDRNPKEFSCIHKHDVKLNLEYPKVFIYLYRNPLDTIYSMLKYDKKELSDIKYVQDKTILYAKHMKKWLLDYNLEGINININYESLKDNPVEEFRKVSEFFNVQFQEEKFTKIYTSVNHNKIKEKTKHDNQILNNSDDYLNLKSLFKQRYKDDLMNWFYSVDPRLNKFY